MGIRPQMHLVFGIDDFFGELPENVYETRLYISDEELEHGPSELGYLKDVFYDHIVRGLGWGFIGEFLYHGAGHVPGVLGMSINQTSCDSDLVRVLSVFYPEFFEAGKLDLPVWDADEHRLYTDRVRVNKPKCIDIEFQWSWFYPSVVESHGMWSVHAYCTRWLLQQVGIDIDYRRFKAMLVWDWR